MGHAAVFSCGLGWQLIISQCPSVPLLEVPILAQDMILHSGSSRSHISFVAQRIRKAQHP